MRSWWRRSGRGGWLRNWGCEGREGGPELRVWPVDGKPVLMAPEGDAGPPALGFDVAADRVVLLAGPPGS